MKRASDMSHEGPKAKRRATAADRLELLQEEYEAMGAPSADKITQVVTHNETYPKLHQQLQRRRSVADVADVDKAQPHASSSRRKRRLATNPRRRNLSRVTKKRHDPCTCSRCLREKLLAKNRRMSKAAKSTDTAPVKIDPNSAKDREDLPPDSVAGSDTLSKSSLRSYYSTDHEPMV